MNTNRLPGGFETLLMLAVLRLGENAYGVTIRQELLDKAGKDVAVGAIYTGLERLARKGYVQSRLGDPTPERGGRAKRFYRLTGGGVKVLNETQSAMRKLSAGLKLAGGAYA